MMGATNIPYATKSWHLGAGCDQAGGPGCEHCWASRLASTRLKHLPLYRGLAQDGRWTGEVRVNEKGMNEPFRWRGPQVVFVAPMTDFFLLPLSTIAKASRVMEGCSRHTFLIVTHHYEALSQYVHVCGWSLPKNVLLLPTCENQERANLMLSLAGSTGARVVANLEPMLGPVNLECFPSTGCPTGWMDEGGLAGVVVGGESGPQARPMMVNWALNIRDQCRIAGVPLFVKQISLLEKGRWRVSKDMHEWPEPLRVQEFLHSHTKDGPCHASVV